MSDDDDKKFYIKFNGVDITGSSDKPISESDQGEGEITHTGIDQPSKPPFDHTFTISVTFDQEPDFSKMAFQRVIDLAEQNQSDPLAVAMIPVGIAADVHDVTVQVLDYLKNQPLEAAHWIDIVSALANRIKEVHNLD